ncbi:DUF952 domain-containing protein [uncultured Brevundimonas sp.]|uniref:DUF952 domain-containing protein n=1 Tax=uncultured Brevundimonas sp. TaxID=213418 RepID=UPI0025F06192|nr:DUF952 domain-containing protein [uncultured Brevundimonas sp.]
MTPIAYKLVDGREWQAARADGVYCGSVLDRADGFIHLSTAEQLPGTASKHYAGREDLRLVEVDLTALADILRWEPSRGGDLFPHIYGDLPMTAVGTVRGLAIDSTGTPRFADGSTIWPAEGAP